MAEKILIIDDDPYSIQGMSALLADQYDVFGAFTVAQMVALLKKHVFALTILDLDLQDEGNGLDLIQTIQEKCGKVLVLTTSHSQANLRACLREQVCGFMHKRKGITSLLPTVRGAIAGHNMTEPSLLSTLTDEESRLPRFGWREQQLINLIYTHPAASTAEYAKMINLAEGSVKNMLGRLFSKMKVHKKIQLLEKLKERGHRPMETTKKPPERVTR
jgi:DNA-binding NarL/FixJ family response regulator